MAEKHALTIDLDPELDERLEALAERTKRSKAFLVAHAITTYVELSDWHISEIEKGIAEADAGDFASDEEVAAAFARWKS